MGEEGGDPGRGDRARGDDTHRAAAALGLIEQGISRLAVVAEAKLVGRADLPGGEKGGEGGGIPGQLVRSVGFDEGEGVGLIQPGKVAIGVAGLGEGEELLAGSRHKKDDDGMGTGADEVADVAGRRSR